MESSQGQEGMDWVFDDDSKMSESQRTPLPACLPSVSQCPKSVVINPLKYLEYFADSPWDTDKGSCSRDTHQRGAHPRDTHLQATHPLETHMQATHSRDTNLQATHPLETHLRATHPLETHLQATHSRDTNLQATHPLETHLQVTHSRETHLSETHLQATHPSATHQQDTDPMAPQTHTSHTSQTQAATATHRPTYIQGVSYGPLVTAGTARTEMYGRDERHPAPYQHTWQGAGGGRGQQVYDTGWQGESYVPHYYQHLSQALPSDTKLNPWHQNPVTHPRPLLDLSDPIFPRYVFQPPPPRCHHHHHHQ
ncbi:uncharacterized protein LOC123501107 [Portunus trituberculatus]|uniref:uncharacterized protein LOC123501107 n=1 Tax=Portunus trituberculatus TaxID=210409 RepID=UPI001E1CFDDF|nr:uncharacterized protein LOC123501107 [Portunus trituberculatus]